MSLKHPSVRSSRETEPIGGRKHTDRSKRRKVYFKESTHMILERLAKAKSAKEARPTGWRPREEVPFLGNSVCFLLRSSTD